MGAAGVQVRWAITVAVVVVSAAALWFWQRPGRVPDAAVLLPVPEQVMPEEIAPTAQPSIGVDIVGAVQRPGLYFFGDGARVADAIASAGGFAPDANRDAVNLAVRLKDEEQIRVPRVGDADMQVEQAASTEASGKALLDINTADAAALESLPDIGPAMAQRIMEYRKAHGPFRDIEQLQDVSGIGAATISALRDLVVVNP